MQKLVIVKIGGNVIDDEKELKKFLSAFAAVRGNKILVHGGGKIASELAKKLGITQQMVNGRRITDAETLKVATMVYAGLLNKQIVTLLQSEKNNALGLSGADLDVMRAEKRKNSAVDYGFVGDILPDGINAGMIAMLLEKNIVPVFCSLTHDGKGQLLNTNADTIASSLAVAMAKKFEVQLSFCFEKKGVLKNMDDEHSLISKMNHE